MTDTTERKQPTCAERIRAHWHSRRADFRAAMKANDLENVKDGDGDTWNFYEYGLAFDYVAAGTFPGQRQGYWRYQLSWGGPSDELRFYGDPDGSIYRVSYRFHDWFDGAGLNVTKSKCVQWLIDWFEGADAFRSARKKAHED